METKKFAPVFILLLGMGIIFGSYNEFATSSDFGFDWFTKMLWFVLGTSVLFIIVIWIFAAAESGEAKILAKEE